MPYFLLNKEFILLLSYTPIISDPSQVQSSLLAFYGQLQNVCASWHFSINNFLGAKLKRA